MDRLEGARSRFDLRLAGAVIIQVPLWLAGRWLFQAETSEGAILSSLVCAETFLLLVMGLSARRPAESPPVALPQMAEIESLRAGLSEREAQLGVAQARVRDIDNTVGSMQRAGSDCLDLMRASCVSLRRTADDVSRAALRISTETTTVAVTAEDADRKIAGVAMFGQDFASSISQIGECAARSARMGIEASGQIETAIATIEELKSTSDGIGAMTALISKIADQTNLLALNATIEAARAGEQGRGFAVVAGEVKALATETGKAVAAIGDMVAKIRGSTDRTVVAIGAITTALRDLNGASTDISAAIGQRVAAADSMADGLTETATCISFVAAAIKNIESAADETLQDAGFLHATADEIAQYAETIRGGLARCADGLGAADPPAGARARRVANGTHEQDAREAA